MRSIVFIFVQKHFKTLITRYFGCNDQYHEVIRSLGLYEYYPNPSFLVYERFKKGIICPAGNWKDIQKLIIGFMYNALDSTNDIVANMLHKIILSLNRYNYPPELIGCEKEIKKPRNYNPKHENFSVQ